MSFFARQVEALSEKANIIVNNFFKAKQKNPNSKLTIPQDFQHDFFRLVDQVCLGLMEDKDNFFGYFLFQMSREMRFNLTSPTAVNFQKAKYVIYFNPLLFLGLNLRQMESTIKHEILHIVSGHLIRAKAIKAQYSSLACNLAMDIVVNTYLEHLPPNAVTLERVNSKYSLKLLPFKPFEYYVAEIQGVLDVLEEDEETENNSIEDIETDYNPEKAHDIWEESSDIDEKTLQEFTEKYINNSQKGSLPKYLESIIASLKSNNGELPWNLYLKKLMGTIASDKKKTITRRNRRQPERLDLRGELRSYKAKVAVALDISGSISDGEFNQAMKEVLAILKNYNHEITVIECDCEIRRVYKIRTAKDIKERLNIRGSTRFTPVFEYANKNNFNMLIYFTDGKGEEKLVTKPKGYKTLWVISGNGDKLSLIEPYGAVKKLKNKVIDDEILHLTMSDVKREGFSMNDMEEAHI
ncbi:MAG TPA: M48 family metalloprotease [Peptococcaceae bacterium]|nr:M48 family metalloprotease [Peptococcaceae bacterium]